MKTKCKHWCSPSCHPAQTGDKWLYGCTHIAWPANKSGDFCPIVECDGDQKNCDLVNNYKQIFGRYKSGLTRRRQNAWKKLAKLEDENQNCKMLMNGK